MADKPVEQITVTFDIPDDDPDAALQLKIIAGTRAQAIAMLSEIKSQRDKIEEKMTKLLGDLPAQSLALRQQHDNLLKVRNTMRRDCKDLEPLRAPRGSKQEANDSTES